MLAATWEALSPAVDYRHANDTQARSFVCSDTVLTEAFPKLCAAYDRLPPVSRPDVWRAAALYVHGGVATDVDVALRQPLEAWLPQRCGLVVGLEDEHVARWLVAARPRHGVLKRALDVVSSGGGVDWTRAVEVEVLGALITDALLWLDAFGSWRGWRLFAAARLASLVGGNKVCVMPESFLRYDVARGFTTSVVYRVDSAALPENAAYKRLSRVAPSCAAADAVDDYFQDELHESLEDRMLDEAENEAQCVEREATNSLWQRGGSIAAAVGEWLTKLRGKSCGVEPDDAPLFDDADYSTLDITARFDPETGSFVSLKAFEQRRSQLQQLKERDARQAWLAQHPGPG
ncbi:hypothetical protein M885DRAFT_559873 [Pelagophyceae sp. CCMP2097]|nr:hypothetical protein M885DRAFT_559873 [Pelagophyceae sp. CCMP2097]